MFRSIVIFSASASTTSADVPSFESYDCFQNESFSVPPAFAQFHEEFGEVFVSYQDSLYHELATAVFLQIWKASGGSAKLVPASNVQAIFEGLGPYPPVSNEAVDFDIGILIEQAGGFDPSVYIVDPSARPTPSWPASIGYLGIQKRSGLYMVSKKIMNDHPEYVANWYRALSNENVTKNFPRYSNDTVTTLHSYIDGACTTNRTDWNKKHPLPSGRQWCNEGNAYVPPQCDNKNDCFVIYKSFVDQDSVGILEQLIYSYRISAVVQYINTYKISTLPNTADLTNSEMLVWLASPSSLITMLDAERIVFPSYLPSCDPLSTNAESVRFCDTPGHMINKFASEKLYSSPFRELLEKISFSEADMEWMMLRHEDSMKSSVDVPALSSMEVACLWVKENEEKVLPWFGEQERALDLMLQSAVAKRHCLAHTSSPQTNQVNIMFDDPTVDDFLTSFAKNVLPEDTCLNATIVTEYEEILNETCYGDGDALTVLMRSPFYWEFTPLDDYPLSKDIVSYECKNDAKRTLSRIDLAHVPIVVATKPRTNADTCLNRLGSLSLAQVIWMFLPSWPTSTLKKFWLYSHLESIAPFDRDDERTWSDLNRLCSATEIQLAVAGESTSFFSQLITLMMCGRSGSKSCSEGFLRQAAEGRLKHYSNLQELNSILDDDTVFVGSASTAERLRLNTIPIIFNNTHGPRSYGRWGQVFDIGTPLIPTTTNVQSGDYQLYAKVSVLVSEDTSSNALDFITRVLNTETSMSQEYLPLGMVPLTTTGVDIQEAYLDQTRPRAHFNGVPNCVEGQVYCCIHVDELQDELYQIIRSISPYDLERFTNGDLKSLEEQELHYRAKLYIERKGYSNPEDFLADACSTIYDTFTGLSFIATSSEQHPNMELLKTQPGRVHQHCHILACFNCSTGRSGTDPTNQCDGVPDGFHTNGVVTGAKENFECAPGTVPNDDKTTCNLCRPGEYSSSSGKTRCDKCPGGSYQHEYGQDTCLSPPNGAIVKKADVSLEGELFFPNVEYQSQEGYYLASYNDFTYLEYNESLSFGYPVRCESRMVDGSSVCRGGNRCAESLEEGGEFLDTMGGLVCSQCAEGYTRNFFVYSCNECDNMFILIVQPMLFILSYLLALLGLLNVFGSCQSVFGFRLMLDYLQMADISEIFIHIGQTEGVSRVHSAMITVLHVFFPFTLGSIIQWDCLLGQQKNRDVINFVAGTMSIPIFGFFTLFAKAMLSIFWPESNRAEWLNRVLEQSWFTVLAATAYILQPISSSNLVSLLDCTPPFLDGNPWLWREDQTKICLEINNQTWGSVVYIYVIVYNSVLVALFTYVAFVDHQKRKGKVGAAFTDCSLMGAGVESRAWWYPVTMVLRKMMFIGMLRLGNFPFMGRILTCLSFISLLALYSMIVKPYEEFAFAKASLFERWSYIACMAVIGFQGIIRYEAVIPPGASQLLVFFLPAVCHVIVWVIWISFVFNIRFREILSKLFRGSGADVYLKKMFPNAVLTNSVTFIDDLVRLEQIGGRQRLLFVDLSKFTFFALFEQSGVLNIVVSVFALKLIAADDQVSTQLTRVTRHETKVIEDRQPDNKRRASLHDATRQMTLRIEKRKKQNAQKNFQQQATMALNNAKARVNSLQRMSINDMYDGISRRSSRAIGSLRQSKMFTSTDKQLGRSNAFESIKGKVAEWCAPREQPTTDRNNFLIPRLRQNLLHCKGAPQVPPAWEVHVWKMAKSVVMARPYLTARNWTEGLQAWCIHEERMMKWSVEGIIQSVGMNTCISTSEKNPASRKSIAFVVEPFENEKVEPIRELAKDDVEVGENTVCTIQPGDFSGDYAVQDFMDAAVSGLTASVADLGKVRLAHWRAEKSVQRLTNLKLKFERGDGIFLQDPMQVFQRSDQSTERRDSKVLADRQAAIAAMLNSKQNVSTSSSSNVPPVRVQTFSPPRRESLVSIQSRSSICQIVNDDVSPEPQTAGQVFRRESIHITPESTPITPEGTESDQVSVVIPYLTDDEQT